MPDTWHTDEAALAENWTVPCGHCGKPVTEANSCAEIVAKADGTECVVARRAWCDEDACFEDMISGWGPAAAAEASA